MINRRHAMSFRTWSAHRPAAKRIAGPPAVVAGLMLSVAAISLAACGSGSSPTATPNTADQPGSPSSSSTQSPVAPADAVLAAYRAMWADLVVAARTSDFQSPLLATHASGNTLTLLVQGLAKDQIQGIVTKGKPVLDPQIASLAPAGTPSRASITDCFDNTHWLEYKVAGGLAKNAPSGRRATTADLVMKQGTWKVTQLTIKAAGTC